MSENAEPLMLCPVCRGSGCTVDCLAAHPDDGQQHDPCPRCGRDGTVPASSGDGGAPTPGYESEFTKATGWLVGCPQTLGDAMRLIGRFTESEGGDSAETMHARRGLFDAYEAWCHEDRPETEAPALTDEQRQRFEAAAEGTDTAAAPAPVYEEGPPRDLRSVIAEELAVMELSPDHRITADAIMRVLPAAGFAILPDPALVPGDGPLCWLPVEERWVRAEQFAPGSSSWFIPGGTPEQGEGPHRDNPAAPSPVPETSKEGEQ